MKILIVEDEPLAQQEIKRLLAKVRPQAEVVACLDSIEDTVNYLREGQVCQLILMDIELADGSSFEIFEQIAVKTPVIFTTAYNEYALRAFKVNSIDYLLKPIEEEALEQAISKYEDIYLRNEETQFNGQIHELMRTLGTGANNAYKTRFVVMVGDKIKYVLVEDIAYFFADDNTVFLVQHDKRKFVISNNLEQIEAMLDPQHFFRLTRKYLCNIKSIGDVYKHFNSRLKVTLTPPVDDPVLVSRVKVPEFMKWLGS